MCQDHFEADSEAIFFMDFFKKVKRLRLFEPSLGILGFFLVVVCVIFGFFLLDYKAVVKGSGFLAQSERLLWLKLDEGGEKRSRKVDFLSEEGGGCNVFEGDWIWDDSYPLYQSKDCSFLDEGFRCSENGRPDMFYTKWRWQPKECNLPRPPAGSPSNIRTTLKLDQMDWSWLKWRDADVLVFNTGHWWNYEKTIRGGCYFQEGLEIKMDMEVNVAYEKSLQTVLDWVHREVNTSKTQVFFRSYAPVHFRGGDWRTGGNCHLETLPELGSSLVPSNNWAKYKLFTNIVSSRLNMSEVKAIDVLNITHMTSRRKDGHSSLYYLGPNVGPAPSHRQDCSHWCLPGVPDAWNELLYALFLQHENLKLRNRYI